MEELIFDSDNYQIKNYAGDTAQICFRAFEGIRYCTVPKDDIQKLNIFAPEEYYEGKTINGYTLHTAPIFIPSSVGGYLPGPAEEPGRDHHGNLNSLFYALEHGYVVVSIGVRGRTTGRKTNAFFEGSVKGELGSETGKMVGKAPALIVDMKAGIRYLKKNAGKIPGDVNRIFTNGTSAGGALSALVGASGNHPDYTPYLREIGAAEGTDDVLGANCFCPIHNLEHADMAYEWLFSGCSDYYGMRIEKTPEGIRFIPVTGRLTEKQLRLSEELKRQFPDYVNSLKLKDPTGASLTLKEDGTGSFADQVAEMIRRSAQQELDTHDTRDHLGYHAAPNSAVENNPALTIEDGKVTAVDLAVYAKAITRMKQVPAFDALDLKSPENDEYGTEQIPARHFTAFSRDHSEADGALAEAEIIRMLNPTVYIRDPAAKTAPYFRIRHGSYDRDTALAIPIILADLLAESGCNVDFCLPWGLPHWGDYHLEELFGWIDAICR